MPTLKPVYDPGPATTATASRSRTVILASDKIRLMAGCSQLADSFAILFFSENKTSAPLQSAVVPVSCDVSIKSIIVIGWRLAVGGWQLADQPHISELSFPNSTFTYPHSSPFHIHHT